MANITPFNGPEGCPRFDVPVFEIQDLKIPRGVAPRRVHVPTKTFVTPVPPPLNIECTCLTFRQSDAGVSIRNMKPDKAELNIALKQTADCCENTIDVTTGIALPCVPFSVPAPTTSALTPGDTGDGEIKVGLQVDECTVSPIVDVKLPCRHRMYSEEYIKYYKDGEKRLRYRNSNGVDNDQPYGWTTETWNIVTTDDCNTDVSVCTLFDCPVAVDEEELELEAKKKKKKKDDTGKLKLKLKKKENCEFEIDGESSLFDAPCPVLAEVHKTKRRVQDSSGKHYVELVPKEIDGCNMTLSLEGSLPDMPQFDIAINEIFTVVEEWQFLSIGCSAVKYKLSLEDDTTKIPGTDVPKKKLTLTLKGTGQLDDEIQPLKLKSNATPIEVGNYTLNLKIVDNGCGEDGGLSIEGDATKKEGTDDDGGGTGSTTTYSDIDVITGVELKQTVSDHGIQTFVLAIDKATLHLPQEYIKTNKTSVDVPTGLYLHDIVRKSEYDKLKHIFENELIEAVTTKEIISAATKETVFTATQHKRGMD